MDISEEKFFKLLDAGREDNFWDFKRDIYTKPKEKFYELVKDILAFSNTNGGYLLLGVEDTGKLVGVEHRIDEAELGEKIESTLGYNIDIKLLYFNHNLSEGKEDITLGILFTPESNKIRLSPKPLNSNKGIIVRENGIYVRRNTRSVEANNEDLGKIKERISGSGEYKFKEKDLQFIEKKTKAIYRNV